MALDLGDSAGDAVRASDHVSGGDRAFALPTDAQPAPRSLSLSEFWSRLDPDVTRDTARR